jgi:hypothetical protein
MVKINALYKMHGGIFKARFVPPYVKIAKEGHLVLVTFRAFPREKSEPLYEIPCAST